MEDGSGSTATDFSGFGNDGTLTNMDPAMDWVSGTRGTALDFDDSDDFVDVSGKPVGSNSSMTLSAWVYLESHDRFDSLVTAKTNSGTTSLRFMVNKENYCEPTLKIEDGDGGGARLAVRGGCTPQNQWSHVAVTWDGTNEPHLYVDGEEVSYTGRFVGGSGTTYSADDWKIAKGAGSIWGGNLDEVRIYNRELSSSEIKDLYQSGYSQVNISRKLDNINGLAGWWTMDGKDVDWSGSSGQIKDNSGFGNDGTTNGGMTNSQSAAQGRLGQALNFDGVDDYVESSVPASQSFSALIWVKGGNEKWTYNGSIWSARSKNGFVFHSDTGSRSWDGYIITDSSTNDNKRIGGNAPADITKWHQYGITYDHSTGKAKMYLDGKQVGSNSFSISRSTSSLSHYLGKDDPLCCDNRELEGKLDDARYYNRALSSDEISRIYNTTRPSPINTSRTDRLTAGLVGFWSMNGQDVDLSDSAAEVKDVSDNGNDGDAKNGAQPAIGKLGQGFGFDGVDDYVEITSPPDPSGSGADASYAVTFWMNPNPDGSNNPIIEWSENGNADAHIWQHDSENDFYHYAGAACASLGRNNDEIRLGKWSHYAVVYDKAATQFRLYRNGNLVDSSSQDCSPDTNSTELYFGHRAGDGRYLNGGLDNVRIYDRALSADEVEELYRLGE